jgi:hypothetical protein
MALVLWLLMTLVPDPTQAGLFAPKIHFFFFFNVKFWSLLEHGMRNE